MGKRQQGRQRSTEGKIYSAARQTAFKDGMALPDGPLSNASFAVVERAKATASPPAESGAFSRPSEGSSWWHWMSDVARNWANEDHAAMRRGLIDGLFFALEQRATMTEAARLLLPCSEVEDWHLEGKQTNPALLNIAQSQDLTENLAMSVAKAAGFSRMRSLPAGAYSARMTAKQAQAAFQKVQKGALLIANGMRELEAAAEGSTAMLTLIDLLNSRRESFETALGGKRAPTRDKRRWASLGQEMEWVARYLANYTAEAPTAAPKKAETGHRELALANRGEAALRYLPSAPATDRRILEQLLQDAARVWTEAGGFAGTSGAVVTDFQAFVAGVFGSAAGWASAYRGQNIEGPRDPFRLLQMDVPPSRETIVEVLKGEKVQ